MRFTGSRFGLDGPRIEHGVIQTAGARVLQKDFDHHYASETTPPTAGVMASLRGFDAFADSNG